MNNAMGEALKKIMDQMKLKGGVDEESMESPEHEASESTLEEKQEHKGDEIAGPAPDLYGKDINLNEIADKAKLFNSMEHMGEGGKTEDLMRPDEKLPPPRSAPGDNPGGQKQYMQAIQDAGGQKPEDDLQQQIMAAIADRSNPGRGPMGMHEMAADKARFNLAALKGMKKKV